MSIPDTPTEVMQKISPYRMTDISCGVPGSSPDLEYRLHGYPASSCEMDYDAFSITGRSVTLNLQYNGPDTCMAYVHRFTHSKDECLNPNGLSGSPVFGITLLEHKRYLIQLIGLVIREGNGIIYALDSLVVLTGIFDAAKSEDERN